MLDKAADKLEKLAEKSDGEMVCDVIVLKFGIRDLNRECWQGIIDDDLVYKRRNQLARRLLDILNSL